MEHIEALVQACFDGDTAHIHALVRAGIDINASGRNWNPLHAAIENYQLTVVRYLLAMGADIEVMCCGMRPLHHAIDLEIDSATQANAQEPPEPLLTELLLNAGANPYALDEYGQTPLQQARARGHIKAEHLLVAKAGV
jgi:uncharacterized protein